jgi:hypothetical protein
MMTKKMKTQAQTQTWHNDEQTISVSEKITGGKRSITIELEDLPWMVDVPFGDPGTLQRASSVTEQLDSNLKKDLEGFRMQMIDRQMDHVLNNFVSGVVEEEACHEER